MDFVSGLLLAAVVLFIIGFFIRETVGDGLVNVFKARREAPVRAVNEYLVGATGTVVEHVDDDTAPLKVRIGIERWNARASTEDDGPLEVGAEVEVTAVSGLVLTVVPRADA